MDYFGSLHLTALAVEAVPAHHETGSNEQRACLTPAKAKSLVSWYWKGNKKSVLEGREESQIISRADEKPENLFIRHAWEGW